VKSARPPFDNHNRRNPFPEENCQRPASTRIRKQFSHTMQTNGSAWIPIGDAMQPAGGGGGTKSAPTLMRMGVGG
jgi:hypothetical protein